MITNKRSFWLTLSLVNLSIVALLGFTLRSKILFSLPFIDFSSVLSAHSHFAFAGWAGLALITLLIYDVLPPAVGSRPLYQWVLAGIELSALGMAVFFPFFGYNTLTISFSTLYVVAVVVFVPLFIKDVLTSPVHPAVRLLSTGAVVSLMLSFLGTLGLVYIILTRSGGSLLYRDSIYTFLHFQYNGFFTLSVFALFYNSLSNASALHDRYARPFSIFLCISVVPALFLALLWHNKVLFYCFALLGCVFILVALVYFALFLKTIPHRTLFSTKIARTFWYFSVVSFLLKMLLQVGTIFPQLGNAVYGDRPVIIGFLHLVFLGFMTFFLLSQLTESGYFSMKARIIAFPMLLFATGIFANEILLMLQGLGILLKTNSDLYKWLLWITAFVLFAGAFLIAATRIFIVVRTKKSHLADGLTS